MAKKIEITIDAEGNVHIDAHGFKGKACSTEIGKLLAKLGPAEERRKPEYYASEGEGERARVRR